MGLILIIRESISCFGGRLWGGAVEQRERNRERRVRNEIDVERIKERESDIERNLV